MAETSKKGFLPEEMAKKIARGEHMKSPPVPGLNVVGKKKR